MPTLDWIGKKSVINHHREVPYRLLKCDKDKSFGNPDSGNLLVQGDNLEALKALLPYYAGKVKCIYIDPPYNTGSEGWIYNDNVNSPEIKAWLGKVVGKEAEDLSRHDKWLCMMYPRLRLLKEFLCEDGMIAIQIDDNEYVNLFNICCEIFGRSNLQTVAIKMSEASGMKMNALLKFGVIPKLKEFIILIKKDAKNFKLKNIEKTVWDNEYNVFLENFNQDTRRIIENIENNGLSSSRISLEELNNILSDVSFVPINEKLRVEAIDSDQANDWLQENSWRICRTAASRTVLSLAKRAEYKIAPLVALQKDDGIYLIAGRFNRTSRSPRIQILLADKYLTISPGDFWADIKTTGLENEGGFEFKNGKKPEQLIARIIELGSSKNDLILDSFAGSGTTGAVAHKMGRRHISVEMGDHAVTHIVPRYQKVISGDDQGGISESVGWQGGGGFRYCTLGEPLFDADGNIADAVNFSDLAAHVFFCETGAPIQKRAVSTSPFIGTFQGRAIYLLYAKDSAGVASVKKGNVLDGKTLDALPKAKDGNTHRVIYAEGCTLSESRLRKEGVTFKHIPYQIAGA